MIRWSEYSKVYDLGHFHRIEFLQTLKKKTWLYFHQEAQGLLLSCPHLKTLDQLTKLTTSSTTNSLFSVIPA
jgi:hypothetical protein